MCLLVCRCAKGLVFRLLLSNVKIKAVIQKKAYKNARMIRCIIVFFVCVHLFLHLSTQRVGTLMLPHTWARNASEMMKLDGVSCDWRSIQAMVLFPFISHGGFLPAVEWIRAELSKQSAHLGFCYKALALSISVRTLYLTAHTLDICLAFRSQRKIIRPAFFLICVEESGILTSLWYYIGKVHLEESNDAQQFIDISSFSPVTISS